MGEKAEEEKGIKSDIKNLNIDVLERGLKDWHDSIFPATKGGETRDANVARGKAEVIEYILSWIDAARKGEVSEQ